MNVALSTIGKFHTFDLARQLQRKEALQVIFTGYPSFKLRDEKLSRSVIRTFPWFHTPYMGLPFVRRLRGGFRREWEYWDRKTFDKFVSRHLRLCDIFVGLSGAALLSGKAAHRNGAKYVCDRGSTHIQTQNELLLEEFRIWGRTFEGIDRRIIDLEEAEYAEADCITVPSSFNQESFVKRGFPPRKIRILPYGVDLSRFRSTAEPPPDRFDVLFAGSMSLRKGIPYLLQAYRKVRHPKKSLTIVGSIDKSLITLMRWHGIWDQDISVRGHVAQSALRDLMSKSHALVLPSIEEGLAMVQAQAMACRCPVIATDNTGARELFEDGREGFIVPIRNPDAIAESLQRLANNPRLREAMGNAAVTKVQNYRGWDDYGDRAYTIYREVVAQSPNFKST